MSADADTQTSTLRTTWLQRAALAVATLGAITLFRSVQLYGRHEPSVGDEELPWYLPFPANRWFYVLLPVVLAIGALVSIHGDDGPVGRRVALVLYLLLAVYMLAWEWRFFYIATHV